MANATAAMDFAKRITSNFGIEVNATCVDLHPAGGPSVRALTMFRQAPKYQLLVDGPHETIFAIGVDADIGGTGAKRIGAERFHARLTPAFFFGKGFGDLSPAMSLLRPLAITGSFGVGVPAAARARAARPVCFKLDSRSNTA